MKNSYKEIVRASQLPFLILVIIWGIHVLNLRFPELELYKLGTFPRRGSGLLGILTSPFVHSTENFSHIINNSGPLFVLMWLTITTYKKLTYKILLFIWIAPGLWVWLAARDSYHIGASGVIYGLAFFLFFSGVFKKSIQLMGISMLVVFLYGSMIWGIFPIDLTVSFEGHLFGAIGGLVMAYYLKEKGPAKDTYNLTVDPEFAEKVDEYNRALFEEQYWQSQINSTLNKKDEFDVFFNYIKKEKEK